MLPFVITNVVKIMMHLVITNGVKLILSDQWYQANCAPCHYQWCHSDGAKSVVPLVITNSATLMVCQANVAPCHDHQYQVNGVQCPN